MNFIVLEMTYLRSFVPLIIEGNSRRATSRVFIGSNVKYNCPYKNMNGLTALSNKYNFEIKKLRDIANFSDITFLIEGVGIENVPSKCKKISLAYGIDFLYIGKKYIDKVDNIIFPSEFIARYYNWHNEKNLYLGDPKYDVQINKGEVLTKYDIKTNKNALIIFPRPEVLTTINLIDIYKYLKDMGYSIIVKARGKDVVSKDFRGDMFFEDFSWYPHSTMELIVASDIVINFNSAAMQECVMLGVPFINFNLKKIRPFDFLYNYKYCVELSPKVGRQDFSNHVERLVGNDWSSEFETARKKHLFEANGISKNILNSVVT